MVTYRSFPRLALALCAAACLSLPAQAQQRFQISDLVQRLGQLESEVARLRIAPGPGAGSDVARLDLIEQELRRLTGIVERLEYDARQSSAASEKRLDAIEGRLSSLEDAPQSVAPPAPPPAAIPFATAQPAPPAAIPFEAAPPYQPQASVPAPAPFTPQTGTTIQSADALYDEGVRLLRIGSFDQAGAQFEDLVSTYPEDPKAGEAQFWLGDMHGRLGRHEQAAAAFLDSFRRWPNGPKAPDSLLKLGMTLATIGQTQEACLSFREVSARYPTANASLLRRADIEAQRHSCG